MIRKWYRIKRRRKYQKKRVLNLFVTLAKLVRNQCNETEKKLRND